MIEVRIAYRIYRCLPTLAAFKMYIPWGFKPLPECAILDSRVSDQGRICDFIYRV